jgi:hypothetical protein
MSTEAARRSTSAIAFIVAGAAILLAILVFITQAIADSSWLYLIAYLATAAGLVLLARNELENRVAKLAALFAALGWVMLTVAAFVPALPGIVASSAYLVILAASVVLGVVVVTGTQLQQRSRLSLVVLLGITVLYMLSALASFYGPFAALLTILLGVLSLATGYFLYTRR